MTYLFLKTLHLIGLVSWFAALFYLPRLFIYHVEALGRPDEVGRTAARQYTLMEERLYGIIMQPALWITALSAIGMLLVQPALAVQGWIIAKYVLMVPLVLFHFYCGATIPELAEGKARFTHMQWRKLNELPTIILIAMTTLAVYKQAVSPWILAAVCLVIIVLFGFTISLYARLRRPDIIAPERGVAVER